MNLRNKILAYTILIILLLGLTIAAFVKTTLTETLMSRLMEEGISDAEHVANMSVNDILTDNKLDLSLVLIGYAASDKKIKYVFITDEKDSVLAHTFDGLFPKGLKNANVANKTGTHSIQHLKTNEGGIVDVAVPISHGQLGNLHIGFSEKYISDKIDNITNLIYLIIAFVFAIGGVLAFVVSSVITKPIHKLTEAAEEIGRGNLDKEVPVMTKDEIGHLGISFNQMVKDLRTVTASRDELNKEIAERKKAEKKIIESRLEWENTFDLITDAITIHDKDFNVIQSNTAADLILDLPILKDSTTKCYKYYHGTDGPPDGCPSCDCVKTGVPASFEIYEPHLKKYIEIRAMPRLDHNNQIIGVIHLVRDITERNNMVEKLEASHQILTEQAVELEKSLKEAIAAREALTNMLEDNNRIREDLEKSRARLMEAQKIAHVGSWEFDIVNNEFICSDEAYRIFGSTRQEFGTTYETFIDIVHPEDREFVDKAYKNSASNRDPYALFHRLMLKDGTMKYVNNKCQTFYDEEGNPLRSFGTLQDITDQKMLEEQLLQSQKMQTVGELAGGVAHDFNNILSVIISYGHLLLMDMSDQEQRHTVQRILAAADRAASLTKSLLAFSRKQEMNTRPVNLNDIIENVKKLILRVIGEDIEITTFLADEKIMIMADSGQIEQVLLNLATNARDSMPKGGVFCIETSKMEIDTAFMDMHGYGECGIYALLSVTDTGVGIDDITKERIFEPFYTTKEVDRGTGLGLAMVYGIIRQHSGYINVYSEVGKGTTFKICLPIIGEEALETRQREEVKAVEGGTETILLAEDEDDVREVTKRLLERFGYRVIEAVDGEDAVIKFRENKDLIQLVILDMIMPRKGGIEAYDEIVVKGSGVKVIFQSGYTEKVINVNELLEKGMNFISKPSTPDELLKKIREVMGT